MGITRHRCDALLTLICNCLTKENNPWITKSLHYRNPFHEFFVRWSDLGQNIRKLISKSSFFVERRRRCDALLTLIRNCLMNENHQWIAKSLHNRNPYHEFFVRWLDLGENVIIIMWIYVVTWVLCQFSLEFNTTSCPGIEVARWDPFTKTAQTKTVQKRAENVIVP